MRDEGLGVRDEGLRITDYGRGLGTKRARVVATRNEGPGARDQVRGVRTGGARHQDHATPIAQRSFVD